MMAWLKAFDGRRPVATYPDDELERLIVRDAVLGLDMPGSVGCEEILWWAMQGYLRLAQLRRCSTDAVFEQISARISIETGRMWP